MAFKSALCNGCCSAKNSFVRGRFHRSSAPSWHLSSLMLMLVIVSTSLIASDAVNMTSNPSAPNWDGDCFNPVGCGSAATPCKFPGSLITMKDPPGGQFCTLLLLSNNAAAYNAMVEIPSVGVPLIQVTVADPAATYKGKFSFQPKSTGFSGGGVFFSASAGVAKFDFTDAGHGIYFPSIAGLTSGPQLFLFSAQITNPRFGGQMASIQLSNVALSVTPSAYATTPRPFNFGGVARPGVQVSGSGSITSTVSSSVFNLMEPNSNTFSSFAKTGAGTFEMSNVQFEATGQSTLAEVSLSNVVFSANYLAFTRSTAANSALNAIGQFEISQSSSVTDTALTASGLNITASSCTRCNIVCTYATINSATMTGASSPKSIFSLTGTLLTTSSFSGSTTFSDYALNIPGSRTAIDSASVSFTNCALNITWLSLPPALGSWTLDAGNTLKVRSLIFTQSLTFNVANLDVDTTIQTSNGAIGTVSAIPSATTAAWTLYSSLRVLTGVSIDMTELATLNFQIQNAAGVFVETDSSFSTRVKLHPKTLRINWLIGTPPVVASAYKLFQNATSILSSPETTVSSFIYETDTYDGLLENVISKSASSGTLGGVVSVRIIKTGLPASEIYMTSNSQAAPYYWDGTSCTTTTTVCSIDLPCLVDENLVAKTPSATLCKLNLLASATSSDAYAITFELPEAASGDASLTLAATNGVVKGKFKFQPKSGASSAAHVTFVGSTSLPSSADGFDFSNIVHGVEFSNLPSSFNATFDTKIVNPRIDFSGDTITFGNNAAVTADASLYSAGKTPIFIFSESPKISIQSGAMTASSTDSSLLPLRLISGTNYTTINSFGGLEMTNFAIFGSSLNAKESKFKNCEIWVMAIDGGAETALSDIQDTCELVDSKIAVIGDVHVSVGASKVENLQAFVVSTSSRLDLLENAHISSILVSGGSLGVFGSVTNIDNLEMRGGKLFGGSGMLMPSSGSSGTWRIDSNAQLLLSNMTIDTDGINNFEYVLETVDGVFVEVADPATNDQISIRSPKLSIQWNMASAPSVGTTYTVLTGHAWIDLSPSATQVVDPRFNGVQIPVKATRDASNGKITFVVTSLPPLPPPANPTSPSSPSSPSSSPSRPSPSPRGSSSGSSSFKAIGMMHCAWAILALVLMF